MPLVRRRLRVSARLIAVTVAAVLAAVVVPAQAAPAASGIAVSKYFFGMHDSKPESWPKAKVGALRLWDAGVSWREIEKTPGVYDFARLESEVTAARAHGAEITLVLGQTPTFWEAGVVQPGCDTAPTNAYCSRYGQGASSVPNPDAYFNYVHALAVQFHGRIAALQVWNEANVPGYWAGSATDMAQLTFVAAAAVRDVNKTYGTSTKLVSPGFVARSNNGFIDRYFAAKPAGSAVANFLDVVGLSLYPSAAGGPEDSMTVLSNVRAIMAKRKVSKPIWNTEINYGLAAGGTGKKPPAISSQRQSAYIVRTFLLNANAHVARVFWYAWDLKTIGNTMMTSGSSDTPTAASKAFGLTQSWMTGSRLTGCARYKRGAYKGTYVCTLRYKGGVKRVFWNPTKRVRMTMPSTTTYRITLSGRKLKLKHSAKLTVDYRPVLVRSKH